MNSGKKREKDESKTEGIKGEEWKERKKWKRKGMKKKRNEKREGMKKEREWKEEWKDEWKILISIKILC